MKTAAWLLRWSSSRARTKATLRWLLLLLVLAWLIRRWVWMPVFITGESMLPSVPPGHLAAINKMAYWFRTPQRGDVVAIWTGRELFIKRVIALPGEVTAVTNGCVYIAGRQLQEPYVAFGEPFDVAPGRIPAGCYFMAGDNRRDGMIALVSADRIVGRVATVESHSSLPPLAIPRGVIHAAPMKGQPVKN